MIKKQLYIHIHSAYPVCVEASVGSMGMYVQRVCVNVCHTVGKGGVPPWPTSYHLLGNSVFQISQRGTCELEHFHKSITGCPLEAGMS